MSNFLLEQGSGNTLTFCVVTVHAGLDTSVGRRTHGVTLSSLLSYKLETEPLNQQHIWLKDLLISYEIAPEAWAAMDRPKTYHRCTTDRSWIGHGLQMDKIWIYHISGQAMSRSFTDLGHTMDRS